MVCIVVCACMCADSSPAGEVDTVNLAWEAGCGSPLGLDDVGYVEAAQRCVCVCVCVNALMRCREVKCSEDSLRVSGVCGCDCVEQCWCNSEIRV